MPDWFPPQEPDYGDDCATCYPANLTPRVLGVSFAGIQTGNLWLPADGNPPNGTFVITQNIAIPCNWIINLPLGELVGLSYDPARSVIIYQRTFVLSPFYADVPIACVQYFNNDFDTPVGTVFWGGTATVIPLWEAQEIIEDVTPIVDPDPLFMIVSMPNGFLVVSYIDRWGDTKIKVKVDLKP